MTVEMKVQFFLMTFQTCVLNDYIMITYLNDVVSVVANDVIKILKNKYLIKNNNYITYLFSTSILN